MKRITVLIWVALFTAILGLQTGFAQTIQPQDTVKTVTLKVKGITCGSDLKIINGNLKKTAGVFNSAAVSKAAPTTTFEVTYNPSRIPVDSIYAIIERSPSCDFPDQTPYRVKNK